MATISWKNNADGTWATAADWSTGVLPGAADTAVLSSASAHTVTHDATTNDTITSLIATSDTLAMTGGSLTIKSTATLGAGLTENNGVLTFDGASTIAGRFSFTGGTVIAGSGATLTATGPVVLAGGVIEGPGKFATTGSTSITAASFLDVSLGWINSGTVADGAQLNLDYPSGAGAVSITNTATGVFDFTADGNPFDIYSTAATFTNAGVLSKTAGTGTTNIYAVVSNTGTITATSGTLELDAGGALNGTIGATGTGALALGGAGIFTLGGTTQTISGALNLDGGTISITAGKTLDLTGSVGLSSGTIFLAKTGTLALSGPVSMGGVTIIGPGTLTTSGSTSITATPNFDGSLAWANSGTVSDAVALNLEYPSGTGTIAVINQSGGMFDLTADGNPFSSSNVTSFTNAGVLSKTGGTNTSNLTIGVANSGTITATSGTLELDAGEVLTGVIGATGTGELAFGGGVFSVGGQTQTVSGALNLDGGTISIGTSKTLSLTGSASLSTGLIVMAKSGLLVMSGTDVVSGVTIVGPGTLETTGNTSFTQTAYLDGSLTWLNTGTVADSVQLYLGYPSGSGTIAIVNAAGGAFDLTTDSASPFYEYSGPPVFTNAGVLSKTGGTGTTNLNFGVSNSGTITATSGTLEFDAGQVLAGVIGATGTGELAFGGGVFSVGGQTQTVSGALNLDGGTISLATGKTLTLTGSVSLSTGIIEIAKSGTLAMTGTDVVSGVTIVGPGTLQTAGSTSFSATSYFDGSLTWVNTGTVNDSVQSYLSYPSEAGTIAIINAAGGLFDLTADGSPFYEPSAIQPTFANAGVLSKTSGTGTTNLGAALSSTGTITATSGTLELDSGGVLGGVIGATGTAALALGGGVFTLAGTAQTITGTLDLDGGTISVATGKSLTLTGADTLYSGAIYIAKTGTLVLSGADVLSSIDIVGPGTLETTGATSFGTTPYFDGSLTWVNTGTVNDSVQSYLSYPSGTGTIAIINAAGGVFDLTADGNPFYQYGGVAENFSNAGVLSKTGGTGTTNLYFAPSNSGTITATSGILEFDDGGTLSGTIGATGTGALALGAGIFSLAGSTQAITGAIILDGGTVTIGSGKTLTLSGAATLPGSSIYGPGTLATTGSTSITSSTYLDGKLAWTNSGTVSNAGDLYLDSDAAGPNTITNAAAGVFDLTADGQAFYDYGPSSYGLPASTFGNAGVLSKTGGTGTSNIYVPVSNTGTITATTGILELDGGGPLGGKIGATGTGALALGAGIFSLAGSTQAITGAIILDGGTVTIGSGKTLTLSGAATLSASSIYGPGTLATTGSTSITSSAYLDGKLAWTNSGTVSDAGDLYLDADAGGPVTIANAPAGVFDLTADGQAFYDYGPGSYGLPASTFSNAGTFAKTGGTATSNVRIAFTNTGTVTAATGTLEFDEGGTFGGSLGGPGTLAFGGGIATLTSTASLTVADLLIDGGTLDVTSSRSYSGGVQATASAIEIASGATFSLTGPFTLSNGSIYGPGTLATTGPTSITPYAYLDGKLAWTNSGTVSDSGNLYLDADAAGPVTIANAPAGVFDLTADGQAFYDYGPGNYGLPASTFSNAGMFAKTGGTATSNVQIAFTNTGTVTAATGTLEFDEGGTFGGSLGGPGTLAFGGSGIATLTSTASLTVADLLIDGGTLDVTSSRSYSGGVQATAGGIEIASGATFSLTGPFTLSSAIYGPGTLATTGSTSIAATPEGDLEGKVAWTNSGTVSDSGDLALDGGGAGPVTIANVAAGVFDLTADGQAFYDFSPNYGLPASTFSNAGMFAKTGGTATSNVQIAFTNTGTVTAATGTLEFDEGGTFGGSLGGAGTLAFAGGIATLTSTASLTVADLLIDGGTLDVTSSRSYGGSVQVTSSEIKIASGATFSLTGSLALSNSGYIYGPGTLATTGSTSIASSASGGLAGELVWINSGTVSDAAINLYFDPDGAGPVTITNAPAGVFDLTGNGQAFYDFGPSSYGLPASTFSNAGTLSKTAGTATSNIAVAVINTGLLTANTGTLELDGGATLNGTIAATGTKGVVLLETGTFVTTGTGTIGDNGTATSVVLGSGETWTVTGTLLDAGHLVLGNVSATATLAIAAGGVFDLTTNDAGATARGSAIIANAGTIAKTGGTGDDIVSIGITNTGLIDAASGTLTLTGAIGNFGVERIEAGSTLELGLAIGSGQTIAFNGPGATLKLDKPATPAKTMLGLGAGDRIDLVGVTLTAASISGNSMILTAGTTTYTFNSTTSLAGDHVQKQSDGGTGTIVTLYADAVAAAHAPEPVVFGNVHVGGTATQTLTVANAATPITFAENLDAGLSAATTGFTTAGTITGLAAGASNATALTITENTANAGTLTGTASLGLLSDGTGIDGFGTTALPSQTVNLSGAVYALAAPVLSSGTVNLGSIRVGGTFNPGTVTLSDGVAASAYQESLVYAASGAGTTNANGTIVAGGTAAVGFTLSGATAGNFAGTQASIALTSTGVGTSGLANTSLSPDAVTINGTVYAAAIASLGTTSLNFGKVHVGAFANQSVGITNAATGALTDLLTAGTATNSGAVNSVVFNLGTGLASGGSGTIQVGISAAAPGTLTGSTVLGFSSHDGALTDLGVNGGTVAVTGTVYALAAPILSGSTLNLGSARVGGTLSAGTITVSDGTIASPYQESLIYTASGPAGVSTTGGSGTIVSGGSAKVGFILSTGTAGNFADLASVALTSTGAGTSGLANTGLASRPVTLDGTIYATAKAGLSGNNINFGVIHIGAAETLTVGVTNTATGALIDLLTGGTAINTGSVGSVVFNLGTGLASGVGGSFKIGMNTGTAGTITGSTVLGFTSHDGALANLAINGGTVTVTGTIDNYATAQVELVGGAGTLTQSGSVYAINLGNVDQGGTALVADLGVLNSATGPADLLGGSFAVSGASAFGNSGMAAFAGLGASTDERSQVITLNTGTVGVFSETMLVTAYGTNASGYSGTLTTETVTVSGTVDALATPIVSTGTLNLGNVRVGGTLAGGTVILSNGTAAMPNQESLIYTASGPGGIGITNATGTIVSGGTAQVGYSLSTATAGDFTATQAPIALTSTGAGTDGLGNTILASDTVTINGKVYAPAVALLGSSSINLGIVHVGDTVAPAVGVTNTATAALVDLLTGGTATNTGGVGNVTFNLGTGLASGTAGTVQFGISTASAGTIAGSSVLGFTSHDGDLSDIAINGGTVTVTGTIDNYATAQIELTGGTGTLTHSGAAYTLNLGSVFQNGTSLVADLGVLNAAGGPADLLGGSFTVGGTTAFTNSGLVAFTGLGAGAQETSQVVTLNTGTGGVFSETITLHGTGSNASGYSGTLAAETLTVTGTVVVLTGQTYTLTAAPATITGTTGNDVFNAASNTLNSHDQLDGNTGSNTLNLVGGGYFDLGAPAKLVNMQIVTAQESSAGTTVYMRNSLNVTVNVAPSGSGTLTVYGANDSDVYNLGAGSDTVVLGAATEKVNGGGGTALVQGAAAFAGAAVVGGSTGTTTLEVTSGGNVTLNAADTNLTVTLDATTNLGLGSLGFITAIGSATGGETMTAGGANQTLQSVGGRDTLVGSSSFGDTFLGSASGFLGDTIKSFGGSDVIDFSDIAFATVKPLSYTASTGKLVVTDATHAATLTFSGSYTAASFSAPANDGHGGTLIRFV
jgi:hypothetical protein